MNDIDNKQVGCRIKEARNEMGLSQAEFAERCGYSTNFISGIENGKPFSMETLKKLTKVTEMTADQILHGEKQISEEDRQKEVKRLARDFQNDVKEFLDEWVENQM